MKQTPIVKVIKIGTITHEASEIPSVYNLQLKYDLGIGGGSTVTLVEANRRILVDTGFDYESVDSAENKKRNASNLTGALKDQGIKPDDIDIVFITHWHRDHFGNLGIFKKARYMAAKPLVKRFGLDNFKGTDDGEEIAAGVKVALTPGHTIDHASILVDTTYRGIKVRIAIAGDAVISHSYFQTGHIWKHNADFYDAEKARDSLLHIINSSDVIIPGHGVPFMTYKPEWL